MPATTNKNGKAPKKSEEQLGWELEPERPVATEDPDHPLPLQEHLHQLWLALGLDDE